MLRENIINVSIPENILQVKQFLEETKKYIFDIVNYASNIQLSAGIDAFFNDLSQTTDIPKEELISLHKWSILFSQEYKIRSMFAQPELKKDVTIDPFSPSFITDKQSFIQLLHNLNNEVRDDFLFIHETMLSLLQKCNTDASFIRVLLIEIDRYEKMLVNNINNLLSYASREREKLIQTDDFKENLDALKNYPIDEEEQIPAWYNEDTKKARPTIAEGIIYKKIGFEKEAVLMLQGIHSELISQCEDFIFNTLEINKWDDFLYSSFEQYPLYAGTVFESKTTGIYVQICILQKLMSFLRSNKIARLVPNKDISDSLFTAHDLHITLSADKKETRTIDQKSPMQQWMNAEKSFYSNLFPALKAKLIEEHGDNWHSIIDEHIRTAEEKEMQDQGLPF